MPILRTIYHNVKQIFKAFMADWACSQGLICGTIFYYANNSVITVLQNKKHNKYVVLVLACPTLCWGIIIYLQW